jgi:hypothetical protein
MPRFVLASLVVVAVLGGIAAFVLYGRGPEPSAPANPAPAAPASTPVPQQAPSDKIAPAIPKPAQIPATLSLSFTAGLNTQIERQLAELEALLKKPMTAAEADALRWLIHQADLNETLRNEAAKVLLAWNPDWLVADLRQLVQDVKQSAKWRGWCVQYLEYHHSRHKDVESLETILSVQSDVEPAVSAQAVFSLAVLSRDLNWRQTQPERFAAFSANAAGALSNGSAKTPSCLEAWLDAAGQAGLRELAPNAEQMAADPRQNIGVRVAAAKALMRIGRAESLPVLQKCAQDETHPMLVKFAKLALAELAKPSR